MQAMQDVKDVSNTVKAPLQTLALDLKRLILQKNVTGLPENTGIVDGNYLHEVLAEHGYSLVPSKDIVIRGSSSDSATGAEVPAAQLLPNPSVLLIEAAEARRLPEVLLADAACHLAIQVRQESHISSLQIVEAGAQIRLWYLN